MNTRIVGLSRFVAAASATAITAVSAWAFVSSSASIERDPFHFASIMASNARVRLAQENARVRIAQAYSGTATTCRNNPETWDPRAPECRRG
jgi:hypothetical protein